MKPTGLMVSGGEKEERRYKPKKGKRRAWEGLGSEGRKRSRERRKHMAGGIAPSRSTG